MTDKDFQTELARREAEIAAEAKQHHRWCGPNCQTFIPSAYIKARLRGRSKESAQNDYDCCHAVR